jgi:uncharacterized protein (TIGR02145 family)
MKNVMKNQKQCKRFPSWGCKGLLSVALGCLVVVAHAQGVDICAGTSYTIASTVDASGASTYQWLENGQIISGASAATYVVPGTKGSGLYTYIRQAKSADCNEWQSSNEFVVTVFACSFTAGSTTGATATFVDPRDGKSYKTVVMPDGKTWLAQNLNYTKDLTYNAYSYEANGKQFTSMDNGVPAIGSYWCPPAYYVSSATLTSVVASGNQSACDVYGALYTWETAMMVDGKYADETKTSTAWSENWVASNYFASGTAPGAANKANVNNARGGTSVKGGGRGICPPGWHVPTHYEWANLLDKVEGNTTYTSQTGFGWWGNVAGKKLKSVATFTNTDPGDGSWLDFGARGDDQTNFSATSGAVRDPNGARLWGRGWVVRYWTSTSLSALAAVSHDLTSNMTGQHTGYWERSYGNSVRCVRD